MSGSAIYSRVAIGIGLAAVLAILPGLAQPRLLDAPEDTDAFQVAFGMSYYGFDGCGDRPLGERFRRALLERFEQCPFPELAKMRFRSWAAHESARENEILQRLAAEPDKQPDRLDGMKETCLEHRQSAGYRKARELLDRYARGEVHAGVFISCDASAGGP